MPSHPIATAPSRASRGTIHFMRPSDGSCADKYVPLPTKMVPSAAMTRLSGCWRSGAPGSSIPVGTDQQVAPGSLQDYAQWVQLVAAMLRGGFTPEEAGKIAGGNYMRIFNVAVG